jgi:MYXO-CTERM domain-containing protein
MYIKNPCTTDSCDTKSNSCANDPIPGCGQPDKGTGTADAGPTDGPPQSQDGGLDDDAGIQAADGPRAGLPEAGASLDGGVTKNPARALEGGCSVSGSAPPFGVVVLLLAALIALRIRRGRPRG